MKLRLLFSYDDHLTPWNGELGSTVVFWCLLVVVFRVVVVPGLSWSWMPRSAVIPSTPLGSLDENQFTSVTRQHLCNIEPQNGALWRKRRFLQFLISKSFSDLGLESHEIVWGERQCHTTDRMPTCTRSAICWALGQ